MATEKVNINLFIDGLLGTSGTSVSDALIIAGMEDVVRKIENSNPRLLKELETDVAVSSSPLTLHYVPPTFEVYCDDRKAFNAPSKDFISNRYSLLNDFGETTYFYVIGNKVYIYPYDSGKSYRYRGVVYSVNSGVLTWSDRLVYPLGLYCAYTTLFETLIDELTTVSSEAAETFAVNPSTLLGLSYTNTETRLSDDDVELASAEMGKLQTKIAEYSAAVGADASLAQKLASRVKALESRMITVQTIRAQYLEWFGITPGDK